MRLTHCPDCFGKSSHQANCPSNDEWDDMSTDYTAEVKRTIADYQLAIQGFDPTLSAVELMDAAQVLMELEEDPFDPEDYRSISIAINEARGI